MTLERGGTVVRIATPDLDGRVRFAPLAPGRYDLLAEQFGFQPVRALAIAVLAGRESSVGVRLERRPPPIDAPVEVAWSGSASGGLLARQRHGTRVGGALGFKVCQGAHTLCLLPDQTTG